MARKKVAVVLSGCGFRDGGEIHESTLALLYLDKAGFEVQCAAPNVKQRQVMNHLTMELVEEERNVLVESARIARGEIIPLNELIVKDYDAIVFPGGFGAALNSSDFGLKGADCTLNPDVEQCLEEAFLQKKVIGAICIAPALVAKALGQYGVSLTIGTDEATAREMKKLGATHVNAAVTEAVVDKENKIVTTPAYMLGQSIGEIAIGIEKLVDELKELT